MHPPACYTNSLSVPAGERFTIQASARGLCRLEIARLAGTREPVFAAAITPGEHPTPDSAFRDGCGWPVAIEVETAAHWRSGYYEISLTDGQGALARHFIVVNPPRRHAATAIILSTNTYVAYNYWGGPNSYCDLNALIAGTKDFEAARRDAAAVLSIARPFMPLLVDAPPGSPRLMTERMRRFGEQPWIHLHQFSKHDRSAGFTAKWEHAFVTWAEEEGIALDYFIDTDFDDRPDGLDGYDCVVIVGHSEYWTAGQRDAIERHVDNGGGLAIFGGNTAFWQVRFERSASRLLAYKWRAFDDDPLAHSDPAHVTHLWSHHRIARPEAEIIGLTFNFGGYHRLGGCVARGQAGYTVYDETHWALDGADLFYGDVIGAEMGLVGYENDGCRLQFTESGRLKAVPVLGVPANLEIIGIVPCVYGEADVPGYAPVMPLDRQTMLAEALWGTSDPAIEDRAVRGHAVMASFRRGAGEVFNAGTTEWVHGLAAGDAHVIAITRNVLNRFGAYGASIDD